LFVQEPAQSRHGLEVCAATGLPAGLVHPVLARLEYLQWIDSAWDDVPLGQHPRTRRRHYFLTADGVVAARQSLAEAFADRHTPTGFPKPLRGMT